MLKQTITNCIIVAQDYELKTQALAPVTAPTSGTKWDKPGAPKFWYEAKTEEGASYYWHATTRESRWEEPKGGFITMKEQQELASKKDPYGGGGWSRVEDRVMDQQVDMGLQERNEKQQPVIVKFEERKYEYKEKIVTSGRANSFRPVPDTSNTSSTDSFSITMKEHQELASKKDPYVGGGWSRAEDRVMDQQVDMGLQERNEKQQPVIDKFEERKYEYKERTVTSGRANSFRPVPNTSNTSSTDSISKPVKFEKMSESWEQQTAYQPKSRMVYSMPAIVAGGNPWDNDFLKRSGDVECHPGPNSRYSVLSIL